MLDAPIVDMTSLDIVSQLLEINRRMKAAKDNPSIAVSVRFKVSTMTQPEATTDKFYLAT